LSNCGHTPWVIGVVFGLYAAFVAYDLVQLEYGWAQSVTQWKPIADIYGSFGFWPAVSVVPGVGLLLIPSLARKLRALKEQQTGRI
jgi:TRAP-type C4-dicarboxylate transport system permease small subunit